MNIQQPFHKDTFLPAGDVGIMDSGRNKDWMKILHMWGWLGLAMFAYVEKISKTLS